MAASPASSSRSCCVAKRFVARAVVFVEGFFSLFDRIGMLSPGKAIVDVYL
jgi:hypothetical protein